MLDLNIAPYYDDFDEKKNYHKILFNPGRPVQGRELTQLQTILQNQIARHGNHIFRNGTVVIPGHLFYDNQIVFLKLKEKYLNTVTDSYISGIVDKEIRGNTHGVTAKVIHVERARTPNENTNGETSDDPVYVFVRYIAGSESDDVSQFKAGEVITCDELGQSFQLAESDFTGNAAVATINEGIFYVNGYFVRVPKQSVAVSKNSSTPNAKIGLQFIDSIVTADQDSSLNDNALGFSNFAAPGADRYKLDLKLVTKKTDLSSNALPEEQGSEVKFIDLMEIRNGEIQYEINDTKYAEFERILAKRTYDESGDYIVTKFNVDVAEYRSNDRGAWKANTPYLLGDVVTQEISGRSYRYYAKNTGISGSTAPSHTSGFASDGVISWVQITSPYLNDGRFPATEKTLAEHISNEAKMAYKVSSGKAYVQGFEVKTPINVLVGNKARATDHVNSASVFMPEMSYFDVSKTNMTGGLPNFDTLETLTIKDYGDNSVGTCVAYSMEPLAGSTTLRLYVLSVSMNDGKSFTYHAKKITGATGGSTAFSAEIIRKKVTVQGLVTTASTAVNGLGTNFDSLVVGASIHVGASSSTISAIANDAGMTAASSLGTQSGVPMQVEMSTFISGNPLVIPCGKKFVKSLRGEQGEQELSFTVAKKLAVTGTTTTIPAVSGETLVTGAIHVYSQYNGGSDGVSFIAPSNNVFTTPSENAEYGELLYFVTKSGAAVKEKIKRTEIKTIYVHENMISSDIGGASVIANGATGAKNTSYRSAKISLTEADAIRILKIEGALSGTDYTSRFALNRGVKPTFYDLSTAEIKSDASSPQEKLKIIFEYYSHSAGDYFSVNSYIDTPYHLIDPTMRDSLDFRPRISDDGSGFSAAGSVITSPLKIGDRITFDYDHYLPRRDAITVNRMGKMYLTEGTSSIDPVEPTVDQDAMPLYSLLLSPYTTNNKSVSYVEAVGNRYTMEDIRRLEKRVKNLEEYVSLSVMEKNTADMVITDEFGLNKFKNGFFVDQFKDDKLFDQSRESLASVDPLSMECRPPFLTRPVVFNDPTSLDDSEGYLIGKGAYKYAMLRPIDSKLLVSQPIMTGFENINPFNIILYNGEIVPYPSVDTWVEQETRGSRNVTTQKLTEQEKNIANARNTLFGTWGFLGDTAITRETRDANSWGGVTSGSFNVATNIGQVIGTASDWEGQSWTIEASHFATVRTNRRSVFSSTWSTGLEETSRFKELIKTEVLNYVRDRKFLIQVKGYKPFSPVNVFVNGKNMTDYLEPVHYVEVSYGGGSRRLADAASGAQTDSPMHRNDLTKSASTAWMVGEAFQVGSDPSKIGIVVFSGKKLVNGVEKECIGYMNIRPYAVNSSLADGFTATRDQQAVMTERERRVGSALTQGAVITGASGAVATVVSVLAVNNKADFFGQYYGVITIPPRTIQTGNIKVEIIPEDNLLNRTKNMPYASGNILSTGTLNVMQDVILQREVVNRSGATESFEFTHNVVWQDPLAQSFLVVPPESQNFEGYQDASLGNVKKDSEFDYSAGIFVDKVDLFFKSASDVATDYVTVQICEMENGYPSTRVVPNASVRLYAFNRNIDGSATKIINTSDDGSVKTTVTFPVPVYLKASTEYCLKLLTSSNKFEVHIARTGEIDYKKSTVYGEHTSQFAGSLFKSQNNSTWSATQTEDLAFNIWHAVFDDTKSAVLEINKKDITDNLLPAAPFKTKTNSTLVRVTHPNHGLEDGHLVIYQGITGTSTITNGVEYEVSNTTIDTYTLTISAGLAAAASTGNFGGSDVVCVTNIKADVVHVAIPEITPQGTQINHTLYLNNGEQTTSRIFNEFTPNNDIVLPTSHYVLSVPNERELLGGSSSFSYRALLSTANPLVTPLLLVDGLTATVVTNRIDTPDITDSDPAIDYSPEINTVNDNNIAGNLTFNQSAGTVTVSGQVPPSFYPGQVIRFTKIGGGNDAKYGTLVKISGLVMYFEDIMFGTQATTFSTESSQSGYSMSINELFVDELAPRLGFCAARYQSMAVTTEAMSSSLKIMFDATIPDPAELELYYRTTTKNDFNVLDNMNWVKVNMNYAKNGRSNIFNEQEYDISNLPAFNQFQVKVSMKSSDSAQPPRIKNMRVIALA